MVAETRIKEIVDDNQRNQSEQVEKALLRHKHALGKLRIEEVLSFHNIEKLAYI